MGIADVAVLLGSVAVLAGLGWFFFGPRRAHLAEPGNGVQRVRVTGRGG
jgi:Cu+-exporting ATPase